MDPTKFGKILSLAASDNEAEALRALQVAKRMLDGAGLDFVDLAHLATSTEEGGEAEAIAELQESLARIRRENRLLKVENRRLRTATPATAPECARDVADVERKLAAEMSARARAEAERLAADEDAVRMAAEIRQLAAACSHLRCELERSEHERYRLIAEARKDSFTPPKRPGLCKSARTPMGQYRIF
ncbi:hypothetical protein [Magnetospirillum sp. UT-4]|uniref:hypothetical protein n=1 Tax=Magnetospirillum sp. UT-4 TaxID=2681467 RepID=UPI001572D876|nr:hypothetical protein [Magnetospirillum sp. UT-4]